MRVSIAQIAPVFLRRDATIARVAAAVRQAAAERCALIAFGEALIPGYPIWLSRTDAARFNADNQKELHALYAEQSVRLSPDGGDLAPICAAAREGGVAVVLGIMERAADRGGHSLYCSRVFIGASGHAAGRILSVHRKLMPTYEERLAWAQGDGAGLVTHDVGGFSVGALNCWENWMPLTRAALYAAGENLHVMLWPGSAALTRDITRFAALEGRSYVLSAGAILRESDIPSDIPQRACMAAPGELIYDGGSCIAGPDGAWLIEPLTCREDMIVTELDLAAVLRERQNFDPAGHYARPDVLRLQVDRRRQAAAEFRDS